MVSLLEDVFDYFKSLGKTDMQQVVKSLSATGLSIDKRKQVGNKTRLYLNNNTPVPTDLQKDLGANSSEEVRSLIKQTNFTLKERDVLITELNKLRAYDVVETILDVMVDDGLISANNNSIFSKVTYKNETLKDQINMEMANCIKKIKLDKVVLDFIDEALLIGEYILPIEFEDKVGVTKVLDNAEIKKMVCVYEGQVKKYFLRKEKDNSVKKLDKDTHIHFLVNPKKLRVEVKEFGGEHLSNLHIKVGRSVIFPVINKIKQLKTLELANLAGDLRDILRPTIVQVGMPNNTLPEHVGEILEKYENIFRNIFSSLKNSNELTFEDLLSVITEVKAIPSFGNEKGAISSPDIVAKSDNKDKEDNIRKSIGLTVGIPLYYLTIGETVMGRLESLKLFSRYSRKLNSMQSCLIDGVKEILCIDLNCKGYKIDPEDIDITMREIVNVELLDSMEYLVALVTAIKELMGILFEISGNDQLDIVIDSEQLLKFLNSFFSEFPGADKLLKFKIKNPDNNQQTDQPKDTSKIDYENPDVKNNFNNEKKNGDSGYVFEAYKQFIKND